jgi:hypothetical protein
MSRTVSFYPGSRVMIDGKTARVVSSRLGRYIIEVEGEMRHRRVDRGELMLPPIATSAAAGRARIHEKLGGSYDPPLRRVEPMADAGGRVIVDGLHAGVISRCGKSFVYVDFSGGGTKSFRVPSDRVVYA